MYYLKEFLKPPVMLAVVLGMLAYLLVVGIPALAVSWAMSKASRTLIEAKIRKSWLYLMFQVANKIRKRLVTNPLNRTIDLGLGL